MRRPPVEPAAAAAAAAQCVAAAAPDAAASTDRRASARKHVVAAAAHGTSARRRSVPPPGALGPAAAIGLRHRLPGAIRCPFLPPLAGHGPPRTVLSAFIHALHVLPSVSSLLFLLVLDELVPVGVRLQARRGVGLQPPRHAVALWKVWPRLGCAFLLRLRSEDPTHFLPRRRLGGRGNLRRRAVVQRPQQSILDIRVHLRLLLPAHARDVEVLLGNIHHGSGGCDRSRAIYVAILAPLIDLQVRSELQGAAANERGLVLRTSRHRRGRPDRLRRESSVAWLELCRDVLFVASVWWSLKNSTCAGMDLGTPLNAGGRCDRGGLCGGEGLQRSAGDSEDPLGLRWRSAFRVDGAPFVLAGPRNDVALPRRRPNGQRRPRHCRRGRSPELLPRRVALDIEVADAAFLHYAQDPRRHPTAGAVAEILDLFARLELRPQPTQRNAPLATEVVDDGVVQRPLSLDRTLDPLVLGLAPIQDLLADFERA
mmetsp:Transcript_43343/g.119909  ORF Transcript_43343/g.119909 Transcript_43343/m.119909 type:complete len:483 (+) Transcript_43343:171-1619(+)